jgi:hypothetical protein
MRAVLVVLAFPPFKFSSKVLFMAEVSGSIKFLRVGFVAPFDFAIGLGASGRNVAVRDSEIRKVPGELRSRRRVVVGLAPREVDAPSRRVDYVRLR